MRWYYFQQLRGYCGGFGCKGFIWHHQLLAALAAKMVSRPVKISLTRRQMFTNTGHRAETRQKIALGAEKNGKLLGTIHRTTTQTSMVDEFIEPCGKTTTLLYQSPNLAVSYVLAKVNLGTPTPTR